MRDDNGTDDGFTDVPDAADDAARLRNPVKSNWEMVPTTTGEVAGVGLEVLVLTTRAASRSTTSSSRADRR